MSTVAKEQNDVARAAEGGGENDEHEVRPSVEALVAALGDKNEGAG